MSNVLLSEVVSASNIHNFKDITQLGKVEDRSHVLLHSLTLTSDTKSSLSLSLFNVLVFPIMELDGL